MNSCTAPRRHGRITHQPEGLANGGFGPDLSCDPPLSHGSSTFEVDYRTTRGFRAPLKWECLGLFRPHTVAAVGDCVTSCSFCVAKGPLSDELLYTGWACFRAGVSSSSFQLSIVLRSQLCSNILSRSVHHLSIDERNLHTPNIVSNADRLLHSCCLSWPCLLFLIS